MSIINEIYNFFTFLYHKIAKFFTNFKCKLIIKWAPFESYWVEGNLSVCPQIWTVASLTCKQWKHVCEFIYLLVLFSLGAIFFQSHLIFFFYNISLLLFLVSLVFFSLLSVLTTSIKSSTWLSMSISINWHVIRVTLSAMFVSLRYSVRLGDTCMHRIEC